MDINTIRQRLKAYTKVDLTLDLKSLPDSEKRIIEKLMEAGKIADHIFWRQSSSDALEIREQYKNNPGPLKEYIGINYGPFDRLHKYERFVGDGPEFKPPGSGFYPEDLSQQDFTEYVERNPGSKDLFEDLYTVISKNENKLEATYYHQFYQKEVQQIATYLDEVAILTQNISLKSYFQFN